MNNIFSNTTGQWSGLRERAISAAALLVLAYFCVQSGGVVFIAVVMLAALLMKNEWDALTDRENSSLQRFGYLYIIIPCTCFIWLRNQDNIDMPNLGLMLVFALIAVISATDIAAYFTGKLFGRYALAPQISPKKTWEGLAGGVLAAALVGISFSPFIHLQHTLVSAVVISICLALLAQAGDLFKSWVKRRAGVKDAGDLIPGHGGVLDRLDGYMFTAPFAALVIYYAH